MSRLIAVCACTLISASCSDLGPASFEVHPGVELVTVTGAEPGTALTLLDAEDRRRLTLITDEAGQAHFAYVPLEHLEMASGGRFPVVDGETLQPGDDYMIRDEVAEQQTDRFSVLDVNQAPSTALYDRQTLEGVEIDILGLDEVDLDRGFQYVEVRDGVRLSVMVRFPDSDLYPPPWPTVVEYSGYSTSRPSRAEPGSRLANAFGYATVGVNMRGTGCSGGVFDVFNPAQWADGYDVIEVVARQPWARGKVGMVGLSYSGISQLFVAVTRPPSLAAITPQSVIADPWEMQWPGGIYNSGFTRQWLGERDRQAQASGMTWVQQRIDDGDTVCEQNIRLRSQNIDFEHFLHGLEFRPPDAEDRSLPDIVERIEVPVYLTGAWQDEQTGGAFGDMLDRFVGSAHVKQTVYNGRHPDGYSPLLIARWFEFLELYVAERVPKMNELVRLGVEAQLTDEFEAEGARIEADRLFEEFGDDYPSARAAYEREPTVRVLFENGADVTLPPGTTAARYEASYETWPTPKAEPRIWYLGSDGVLQSQSPSEPAADQYLHDPDAGSTTFFGERGYELMARLWDIEWTEFEPGRLLSYLGAPFDSDTVVAGPGYATLWMKSDVPDFSVQVTLTEVRADGIELVVQSGWLRAGHRKVQAVSSDRRVQRSYRKEDFEPAPTDGLFEMQVAIPSFAHSFRAGSQLRLMISAPGRNHGLWELEAPDFGGATPTFTVARGPDHPSSLALSVLPDIPVAEGAPPCPSLRGQACRRYRPVPNTPGVR